MRGNIVFVIIVIVVCITYVAIVYHGDDKHAKHNEKYYQTKMCNNLNGIMEYRLKDKTRVDCLTDDLAIEVDWAKKWAESIGQSLYYAQMTNKKPAVGLIVGRNDKKFVARLKVVANKLNIKIIILEK